MSEPKHVDALWKISFIDDKGVKQEVDIKTNKEITIMNNENKYSEVIEIKLPGELISFQLIKIGDNYLDDLLFKDLDDSLYWL